MLVLDPECQQTLLSANGIETIATLLNHSEPNVVLNAIATLMQLIDVPEVKQKIISSKALEDIKTLKDSENIALKKLAIAFGEQLK